MELPETLQEAVHQLTRIPGVGEKTALRQVLALSAWEHEDLLRFGESFKNLANLNQCSSCGFYCDEEICHICSGPRIESGLLCVVESVTDCLAIERSENFQGVYHILGGVLNPLLGIGPEELELGKLFNRLKKDSITDIILAVNPSVEGDATCAYIRQQVGPNVSVERIGFGIPIGGSLEYLDAMTITKALENRKRM